MTDVVLIGGTSYTGKSTVAEAVAARIGGRVVSTDRLGRHPGRPWRTTGEVGVHEHLREHYLTRTAPQLLRELLDHYDRLWPSVTDMVASHRAEGDLPLVLEGCGLLPAQVDGAGWAAPMAQAVWLTNPAGQRRELIRTASRYERLDRTDRVIIDRFVERCDLYEQWMRRELRRLGRSAADSADRWLGSAQRGTIGVVPAPALRIRTAAATSVELAATEDLQRTLRDHDLARWTFTTEVIIAEGVIPHCHPVLTLSTRNGGDFQLASLLHEQVHWHLVDHHDEVQTMITQLRTRYPQVPVGRPDGARDEHSTYLHLIVCWLDQDALQQLVGPARADRVLQGCIRAGVYAWVYRTVIADADSLERQVDQASLRA